MLPKHNKKTTQYMKYIVCELKNQNDNKDETYSGAIFLKRMQRFRPDSTGLDHTLVAYDLIQILPSVHVTCYQCVIKAQSRMHRRVAIVSQFCSKVILSKQETVG